MKPQIGGGELDWAKAIPALTIGRAAIKPAAFTLFHRLFVCSSPGAVLAMKPHCRIRKVLLLTHELLSTLGGPRALSSAATRRTGFALAFFSRIVGVMTVAFATTPRDTAASRVGRLPGGRTGAVGCSGLGRVLGAAPGTTMRAIGHRSFLARRNGVNGPADSPGLLY